VRIEEQPAVARRPYPDPEDEQEGIEYHVKRSKFHGRMFNNLPIQVKVSVEWQSGVTVRIGEYPFVRCRRS
jgi:hypothetical protein